MKMHYPKILLFALPLNILLILYAYNNKNKPYITTHHTGTTTSRVLNEGHIQSSNYNNDEDMKSVKEIFDRQTSQRFEEYEERMKEQRQKRKEERDKNIQKIIQKDKMERSLTEKVEIGCLRCGCGLGGVAASVGIFGTVAVKELAKAALVAAEKVGATEISAAKAMGDAEGVNALIKGLQEMGVLTLDGKQLGSFINPENYTNATLIIKSVKVKYNGSNCLFPSSGSGAGEPFCTWWKQNFLSQGNQVSTNTLVEAHVKKILEEATARAGEVTMIATEDAIKASTEAVEFTYASCQSAIITSVVAIIIIALVMIIIYLVLRYRRKKKMNKKDQYTKLLNQ
ncbi:rifin PIR protein, putative [Plasmodium reichenowi]|uniref:Rifin PIR protein, putative n=1 Tax=Plasmodium reichenowi TaxID=5854 RepID=A0A2P9DKV2_PLARE|nr:rifin PIR protein, putative [Plasmodium reichenowi]